NGRLEERTAESMPLSICNDTDAIGDGIGDELLDLFHRLLVDQRPLLNVASKSGADLELLRRFVKLLHEFFIDACLHEEAVCANAGLAGIAILCGDGALYCTVQIRVVENQERSVASKFHGDLLHGRSRLLDED